MNNMDIEDVILRLKGIREMCIGLASSEIVQEERPVYNLIAENIAEIIPVLEEKLS